MGLIFKPSSHRYWLDGSPVPGVTSLLGGGIPKPALPAWYARVVAEAVEASPLEIDRLRSAPTPLEGNSRGDSALVHYLTRLPVRERDAAAARGTAIHDLGQQYLEGSEISIPAIYEPELTGLIHLVDALELEPLVVEKSLGNRANWYAGRVDFIGTSPYLAGGKPVLIDWKTSNGVYGETALQAAAYARAEFWVTDESPDEEQELPEVVATFVAHIRAGFTNLHPLAESPEEINQHFQQFQYAAEIARRAKDRKEYVKPALDIEQITGEKK